MLVEGLHVPYSLRDAESAGTFWRHYLGLDFNATKCVSPTVKELSMKATRAIFGLQPRCRQLGLRDPMLSLFDTLVAPVVHYGCEVWGPGLLTEENKEDLDMSENLHKAFLRGIPGVRKSTPSALLGESGRWRLLEPLMC